MSIVTSIKHIAGLATHYGEAASAWAHKHPARAVSLLGTVHVILSLTAWAQKGVTYDEIAYIASGLTYWAHADFRLLLSGGPLPNLLGTWPLALCNALGIGNWLGINTLPSTAHPGWTNGLPYVWGRALFFEGGNAHHSILMATRAAMAPIGFALVWLCYAWAKCLSSRKNNGSAITAGLLAATLAAFSPTLLAHSSLATSDALLALTLTGCLWFCWRTLHTISLKNIAGLAAFTLLMFLTKKSAFIIVWLLPLLFAARFFKGSEPLHISLTWPKFLKGFFKNIYKTYPLRTQWIAPLGCVLLGIGLFTYIGIWATYGFRFSIWAPDQLKGQLGFWSWEAIRPTSGVKGWLADILIENKLLPEPFLHDFFATLRQMTRSAFLNGNYSPTGFRSFFPLAFLYKTPWPLLVLAASAPYVFWKTLLKNKSNQGGTSKFNAHIKTLLRAAYPGAPLYILIAVYSLQSITSTLNIGHRHLLPIYPALFILLGVYAAYIFSNINIKNPKNNINENANSATTPRILGNGWKWFTNGALGLFVLLTLFAWPNYLGYFNFGSKGAHNKLVDSSLDWGQDAPNLAEYLTQHNLIGPGALPVYISYFGMDEPAAWGAKGPNVHGLPTLLHARSRAPYVRRLLPGTYAISATNFQRVYLPAFAGPWLEAGENAYQRLKATFAATVNPPQVAGVQRNLNVLAALEPTLVGAAFTPPNPMQWELYEVARFARLCTYLQQSGRAPNAYIGGGSILIFHLSEAELARAL